MTNNLTELPNRSAQADQSAFVTGTGEKWRRLQALTEARVGLGRAGSALPTKSWLTFQADHAAARDAVHASFHAERIVDECVQLSLHVVQVESRAPDRGTYLRDPELGRQLSPESEQRLKDLRLPPAPTVVVISDGLSSLAANTHAVPLLELIAPQLSDADAAIDLVLVCPLARVGLLNAVGAALAPETAVILVGERPGLSAPDSLSAYFQYRPQPGHTDAERNCISNIRPAGYPLVQAASSLTQLISAGRQAKLSGTGLKVEFTPVADPAAGQTRSVRSGSRAPS